jgi:hypothetical protein
MNQVVKALPLMDDFWLSRLLNVIVIDYEHHLDVMRLYYSNQVQSRLYRTYSF